MVEKVWMLNCGTIEIDQSALQFGRGYGNKVQIPVSAFLVKTSEGYGLVDTGQNTLGIADPEGTWGARAKVIVPTITEEDDIAFRLKEKGVSPEEIKWVIHTHLHWDHTGGNRHFKQADFYAQKAEYRYALFPDSYYSASYMKNHFGVVENYKLLEGDVQLFSGIWILSTPGHTAGHQSVLLKLATGKHIILPGDAIYGQENIRQLLPQGNCLDLSLTYGSIHKLLSVRDITDAVIVPTHEYDTEAAARNAEFLDKL